VIDWPFGGGGQEALPWQQVHPPCRDYHEVVLSCICIRQLDDVNLIFSVHTRVSLETFLSITNPLTFEVCSSKGESLSSSSRARCSGNQNKPNFLLTCVILKAYTASKEIFLETVIHGFIEYFLLTPSRLRLYHEGRNGKVS
jgi:hypothetical protein